MLNAWFVGMENLHVLWFTGIQSLMVKIVYVYISYKNRCCCHRRHRRHDVPTGSSANLIVDVNFSLPVINRPEEHTGLELAEYNYILTFVLLSVCVCFFFCRLSVLPGRRVLEVREDTGEYDSRIGGPSNRSTSKEESQFAANR